MRVLQVIPAVAPRDGGPSAGGIGMCRALAAEGVETLLATTDADGPGRLDVECGTRTSYLGVPSIFFRRQLTEAYKYSFPFARWLQANVRDFDLVHIHAIFSHSSIAAARACWRHGVPYIVRPINSLHPENLRSGRGRKRVARALGIDRMLARAGALHFTTDAEMNATRSTSSFGRGFVVPLGFDEREGKAPGAKSATALPPSGAPYVVALARLHPLKRLDPLLGAFAAATSAAVRRGWHLVIVGSGDAGYERRLRARAGEPDLAGRVWFTGWLDGDAKRIVVANARLGALVSAQENFGLAVLEMLAAGLPVVVSAGVGIADAVERAGAGWVVDDALATLPRALASAMSDSGEISRRGAAATALSLTYSWSNVAKRLHDEYRITLSSREKA